MNNKCPQCGHLLKNKMYRIEAGYYSDTQSYLMEAKSEVEASDKVRKIVLYVFHGGR